ncbi:MAG: hypothetical protein QNJ38_19935 [Prochloraceae cyanobacterium]|nr:hypothetical protein [Prochloraceae cyanobacterium]
MLGKFREKFPNGGLISELVKIDRHLYIVKASVVVDGITLSSGLASAETIEMAEDKARIRAIDCLQLDAHREADLFEIASTKYLQKEIFCRSGTTVAGS